MCEAVMCEIIRRQDRSHATPVLPTIAVTTATKSGLAVLCSLDQEAAIITCRANGVPESSQSQLKWESNISSLKMGPSYEIFITEWVSAVTVKLELCQGCSDCKTQLCSILEH